MFELKCKAEKSIWIIKPAASSCGRGIRLIHKDNLTTLPAKVRRPLSPVTAEQFFFFLLLILPVPTASHAARARF